MKPECQYPNCSRPGNQVGQLCAIHLPAEKANIEAFKEIVLAEWADESSDKLDLNGAIYKDSWEFLWGKSTTKELIFDDAALSSLHLSSLDQKNFKCKSISCKNTRLKGGLILEHVATNSIDLAGAHVLSGNLTLRDCSVKEDTDISPTTCTTPVFIDQESRFEGAFHLGGAFSHPISISEAHFNGTFHLGGNCDQQVSFSQVHFGKSFSLEGARLGGGIAFSNVRFDGDTSIRPRSSNGQLTFVDVRFIGRTTLTEVGHKASLPMFKKCDLSGLRILNLLSFYTGVQEAINEKIVDCIWPRKVPRWLRWQRFHVADEFDRSKTVFFTRFAAWVAKVVNLVSDKEYAWCRQVIRSAEKDHTKLVNLTRLYRRLHRAYYDGSEFTEASEFYIGLMTVKRKANKGRLWARIFDRLYALLSRYGESIGRPLLGLGLMWFLIPIALMSMGLPLDAAKPSKLTTWFWFQPEGTFFLWNGDYWYGFVYNLASSTLFRGSGNVQPAFTLQFVIIFVETILNLLLVSFAGLAVRRQFAPKKPMD